MWHDLLPINPLPTLRSASDPALVYWLRRDLLHQAVGPVEQLWALPEPARILKKQRPNGSWRYSGKVPPYFKHDLVETFRVLRVLVDQYGFTRAHPQIEAAAEYLLSCQTAEGDIRGILGNQYMPYYHGSMLALLVKAGFHDDPRLIKGLDWLLSMRQDDGGWIVPVQAVPARHKTKSLWTGEPVPPDRSLPHSHLATGMALRALACHPRYRKRAEVRLAATRLKERFFKPDQYNDRKSASYWTKFQYPFWWTHLLMALDTLAEIGYPFDDPDVQRAIAWFEQNQQADGLWDTGYSKGANAARMRLWVGLAVCRVIGRLTAS